MLQYVPSKNFYSRVKRDGKVIRQSLATSLWTTAKLRLLDFLKEQQAGATNEIECIGLDAAVEL